MPKYPKIVIDKRNNVPVNLSPKIDLEQIHDILYHTHKISDLINDSELPGGNGKSAYEIWLSLGNTGSEYDFIDSLKGEAGAPGKDGTPGKDGEPGKDGTPGKDGSSAYQIWLTSGNLGTVQDYINSLKGKDGKSAYEIWLSLGNTGTEEDFINSLKGNGNNESVGSGEDGKSAYEIWLSLGNEGTEEDFINSLKGELGESGENGKSAYEIWLSLGNTGTEEDFINSLKGEPGESGNGTSSEISNIDWGNVLDKPFEGINSDYLNIDSDLNLTLADTAFDDITTRINSIINELNTKGTIDDDIKSSNSTWSSDYIKSQLDKKAEANTNHNHGNLNDVLNKLSVVNNKLVFDSKPVMTTDLYDSDRDNKVDIAKVAETLSGLIASIKELNYLAGAKSNIQSQLDAIESGVNFKGEYSNFATMKSNLSEPEKGDWVYILVDETKNNQENTQYVYNGSEWVYGGGRNSVNDASSTIKGVIQLAGDLRGNASAPQLAKVIEHQNLGYIKSITVDEKGRVISITEDTTLAQRLADLESRPQIYVSETQPKNLKDGDIWIEG